MDFAFVCFYRSLGLGAIYRFGTMNYPGSLPCRCDDVAGPVATHFIPLGSDTGLAECCGDLCCQVHHNITCLSYQPQFPVQLL